MLLYSPWYQSHPLMLMRVNGTMYRSKSFPSLSLSVCWHFERPGDHSSMVVPMLATHTHAMQLSAERAAVECVRGVAVLRSRLREKPGEALSAGKALEKVNRGENVLFFEIPQSARAQRCS